MVNFKKIGKFAGILILALFVLYLGAELGFQVKYRLELWKTDRAMEKFNKAVEEMFKADIDGGKTPEETFNLFVTALKNENVDLAVKYIVLDAERRQNYWDEFNKMKQEGKLKEYGDKLPTWDKWDQIKDNYNDWESRATIEYGQVIEESITVYDPNLKKDTIISPGIWGRSVIFIKNQNNIWKIESF